MNEDQPISILLIEDNPGDIELTREALRSSKIHNELRVVQDGRAAIDQLTVWQEENSLPDLILLDLNLPGMTGTNVLTKIKTTPIWSRIPVVILTSSQAESDIARSYDLHANCYVTKPLNFSQFIQIVQSIEHFWFAIVRLPRKEF